MEEQASSQDFLGLLGDGIDHAVAGLLASGSIRGFGHLARGLVGSVWGSCEASGD